MMVMAGTTLLYLIKLEKIGAWCPLLAQYGVHDGVVPMLFGFEG